MVHRPSPDARPTTRGASATSPPRPAPDPTGCDREPIHIPGCIQPRGALLTVRPADFLVTQASANLASVLGLTADMSLGRPLHEVLGRPLQEVLGHDARAAVEHFVSRDTYEPHTVFCLEGPAGSQLSLRAHRSGPEICIEIEALAPHLPGGRSSVSLAQSILGTLTPAASLTDLCAVAAREFKALTGYDRVMIYRFDEDGNGEVVGEALEPDQAPFMGLHYPATDIPLPARQIYLRQRVRLIADIASVAVPILSDPASHDGAPLDMTLCALRGVSPVHIEYLGNMGVTASFSVALTYATKLWGLVIGHHRVPRWLDTEHRAAIDIIGQVMASLLQNLAAGDLALRETKFGNAMRSLGRRLVLSSFFDELAAPETELLQVTHADGAMVRIDGCVQWIGKTPPADDAMRAMAMLSDEAAGDLLAVNDLGLRYPELASCTREGSGALLVPLSPFSDDAILWFRPEVVQTVTWGGDPNKPSEADTFTERVSPRKSFEAWKQAVRGHCLHWRDVDLMFARELVGVIKVAAAGREVEQQRLLEMKTLDLAAVADRREIAEGRAALTSSRTETEVALAKLRANSATLARSRAETQKNLGDLMKNEVALASSRAATRVGQSDLLASEAALASSRAATRVGQSDLLASEAALASSQTETRDGLAKLLASAVALASSQTETRDGLAELLVSAAALSASRAETQEGLTDLVASAAALSVSEAETQDGRAQLLASAVVNKALNLANALLVTSEAAFRKSEERFRRVVEAAPNAMVIIDVGGTIGMVNAQTETVFGYRRDEMLGNSVEMLMPERFRGHHPGLRNRFFDSDRQARPMGAGRQLFALRKDGIEFPVEISLNPIETDDGIIVLSAIVDISERHTNELVREQQRRELERSNADLEEFAHIASHDLKEPLRGIANNARFLQEDYADKLDKGGIDRLLRLVYLSQRMELLINDLLYFSRLGHPEPAIQSTDLNLVIRDIETMSETIFKEGGAVIDIPRPLPVISCNKTRITEVFRNLITNAIKYNDSATRHVEIGYFEAIKRHEKVQRHVFYVKDNGIGIAQEFHEEVFRIFKRLNPEDDDKKGTGVGLTFVRRIVERDGGQIWLESVPGEGSTFYFNMDLGDGS